MTALPYFDSDAVGSLPWAAAIAAIGRALTDGPVANGPARSAVPVAVGELLLMPAATATAVGVKVLSIAPANPDRGLPRIQGVYVLFSAESLTPIALLDGAALTTLRTPAVSAYAVDRLAAPTASRLVVFGTGPQAQAHVQAISAIRPISDATMVGRAGVDDLADRLPNADIVVCATTARAPVFDGTRLADHACVVAIGSHEPVARELDDTVLRRADRVVVEDTATALREAGDVIIAVDTGALTAERLIDLSAISELGPSTGISVFKSVGMAWQDLAIAQAIVTSDR